jgi:hypothetical protein
VVGASPRFRNLRTEVVSRSPDSITFAATRDTPLDETVLRAFMADLGTEGLPVEEVERRADEESARVPVR